MTDEPEDLDLVAAAWLAQASAGWPDPDGGMYSYVQRLITRDPLVAYRVVLKALELATTESLRSQVAVGPLEDLLSDYGGVLVDIVLEEAHRNRRLSEALYKVALSEPYLTDSALSRLEAALPGFRRLPPVDEGSE